MPPNSRLLVGLTPAPEGFVRKNYPADHAQFLHQWSAWLAPSIALTNLPATVSDDQFARVTHLKPAAVPAYTKTLADAIRSHLP